MPRPPVLLAVWVGGVVLATGTGLLAVRLVGDQVGDEPVQVLTAAEVARAAGSTSPSSVPSSGPTGPTAEPTSAPETASPVPATNPRTGTFRGTGGTAAVRCTGTTAAFVYTTPAQGFTLDRREVHGAAAEVRFTGGGAETRLEISCANGTPVQTESRSDGVGGGDSSGRRGSSHG